MNWLDFIGASLSLLSTYYFTQAKRCAWPLSLVAIALNSILYWQKGIYGNVILETTYSLSMIYGWLTWTSASKRSPSAIRALSLKEAVFYSIIACIAVFIVYHYLIHYTDSDIPCWDALSTVLGLLAQWLLCLKIIHCWIVWFIVDILVAMLQCHKNIIFHSILHWIYLSMAIWGYWSWRKILKSTA